MCRCRLRRRLSKILLGRTCCRECNYQLAQYRIADTFEATLRLRIKRTLGENSRGPPLFEATFVFDVSDTENPGYDGPSG